MTMTVNDRNPKNRQVNCRNTCQRSTRLLLLLYRMKYLNDTVNFLTDRVPFDINNYIYVVYEYWTTGF